MSTMRSQSQWLIMTLYWRGWQMAMYPSMDMMEKSQDSVIPERRKMCIWATYLAKEMTLFLLRMCTSIWGM